MKTFTELDKELARGIDKKYVWMVRAKSGYLYVSEAKPYKVGARMWYVDDGAGVRRLFSSALTLKVFEPIKWEDKEATRISDIYGSNSQPILTHSEREYLKMVLKPFHDEVKYVAKYSDPSSCEGICNKEYLFIPLHGKAFSGGFTFPYFGAGTMYSGMELGKKYKLEELGITYTD